jgi:hypothetical protein
VLAQDSGGGRSDLAVDPCTIPDLGGWVQSNHWGYYVLLIDLSMTPPRPVSIADGIVGHKSGETIPLQIDIRDRQGLPPPYRMAVHMGLSGDSGGSLRPAGKSYRCRSIWFFWSGNPVPGEPPSLNVIEYTLGPARIAGGLPRADSPGKIRPLWAATERIEIDYGETEPATDMQRRDGHIEYPARPVGRSPARRIPNPFWSVRKKLRFFGPNLEPGGGDQIFRQASREYVAIRVVRHRSDDLVLFATSKNEHGDPVSVRKRILLRRLGRSDVFVGGIILIPDGDPYEQILGGRRSVEPVLALDGGMSDLVIED